MLKLKAHSWLENDITRVFPLWMCPLRETNAKVVDQGQGFGLLYVLNNPSTLALALNIALNQNQLSGS